MPDVFSKKKRSAVMSRIRGRGNKDTELALIRLLRRHHITGWRRHQPIFGKPDFVFREARVAVFVDGCFWHGCPKHSNMPANNRSFWMKKFYANRRRDRLVTQNLRKNGWHVVRVWEHELRDPTRPMTRILRALRLKPRPDCNDAKPIDQQSLTASVGLLTSKAKCHNRNFSLNS